MNKIKKMMKINIVVVVTFLVAALFLPVVIADTGDASSGGNTWIVDDEGDGDYVHIENAIANANPGDTIEVYSGIYANEDVTIDKQLILTGVDEEYPPGSVGDTGKPVIYSSGGVVTIEADGVTIEGFVIKGGSIGIYLVDHDECTIFWNNITDNTVYGIVMMNSFDNNIIGNTIEGNNNGVYIISGDNNIIHHNNFIDNSAYNAYDAGDNVWNDSYDVFPAGGNYWSDHLNPYDDYSGENQDIPDPDGDGIIDNGSTAGGGLNPRDIPGNSNQDMYPLMNPCVWFDNHRPLKPARPSGPADGKIDIEYTYSTSTAHPDGYNISYLFDWGDGSQSGWTDFVPSGSDVTVSYVWQTEGSFDVCVKARDVYGRESRWSSVLTVTISMPQLPELAVDVPFSVVEGSSFDVAVSADGIPVEGALVVFLGEMYHTDSDGVVTLIAPLVERDTDYPIVVSHEGYESSVGTITVLNHPPEQEVDKGWIYGSVSDASSGESIVGVGVSVILSDGTILTVFTDEQGYYILVPTGTYVVEAGKQRYGTSTKSITVNKDTAIEVNFVLEKIVDYKSSSVDEYRDMIEAVIDAGISTEKVGGEIDVEPADAGYRITLYREEITVDNVSIEEGEFSFTISADGVPGTIIALRLFDQEGFSDIRVEYDGESIERVGFVDIFGLVNSGSEAKYTRLLTEGENGSVVYCLVYIPHFSEHKITIYTLEEVVKAVGSITIVVLYIAFCLVAGIVFLIPRAKNIIRREMYLRKKR